MKSDETGSTDALYETGTKHTSPTTMELQNGKLVIVWRNVVIFSYLHISSLYGIYLIFASAKFSTTLMAILLYYMGGLGITAGVHRLWSHRAYKAQWPLRLILMIFNTLAHQDPVIHWARDHRVHHKFTETNADPYSAKRGFFFSHVGWLLCRKHPEVSAKGKRIDLSDLYADPILKFQEKYYSILMPLICFILPTVIPMYCWDETFKEAYHVNIFRYVWTLHMTWFVNSAAHYYGNRPYDRNMFARENLSVSIGALGEGSHNFHHAFPWDYKSSELGNYGTNFTLLFLHIMAKIGWAYEMKTVTNEEVMKMATKSGDGTHPLWGWGDKDQTEEYIEANILDAQ